MTQTSDSMKRLINFEHKCVIGQDGKNRSMMGCVPEPPNNIARKIYEYDHELVIWFNRVWGRWMLFRRGHFVMTVQNEDRSYRHLDHRVLHALRKGDSQVRGMDFMRDIEDQNEEAVDSQEKSFDNFVADSAEEMRGHFNHFLDYADDHGAINIPKEDLVVGDKEDIIAKRDARGGSNIKAGKLQPVPEIIEA